jgi:hypothetical protein
LFWRYPHRASYYDDWADAFAAAPFFDSSFLKVLNCSPAQLKREIDEHDLVVALHSCTADTTDDLERLAPVLGAITGTVTEPSLRYSSDICLEPNTSSRWRLQN